MRRRHSWLCSLARTGALGLGLGALLALAPGVFGGLGAASASVLRGLTLNEMVGRADHALVGVVESQEARLVGEHVVTETRIRCTDALLGVPKGTVFTVRHLGGTAGEIGQIVYGEAHFTVGEEVVLLAEKRGSAYYAVGMAQGAMHVTTDDKTGTRRVAVDLGGAELDAASLTPAAAAPTAVDQDGRPLADVVTLIKGLLAQKTQKAGR